LGTLQVTGTGQYWSELGTYLLSYSNWITLVRNLASYWNWTNTGWKLDLFFCSYWNWTTLVGTNVSSYRDWTARVVPGTGQHWLEELGGQGEPAPTLVLHLFE